MWQELVKNSERYKDFIILDKPMRFSEMFANKDIHCVQLHSTYIYLNTLLGFCGAFQWENNQIQSLDGDTYNKDCFVLGYHWFETQGQTCLDILVGEDW